MPRSKIGLCTYSEVAAIEKIIDDMWWDVSQKIFLISDFLWIRGFWEGILLTGERERGSQHHNFITVRERRWKKPRKSSWIVLLPFGCFLYLFLSVLFTLPFSSPHSSSVCSFTLLSVCFSHTVLHRRLVFHKAYSSPPPFNSLVSCPPNVFFPNWCYTYKNISGMFKSPEVRAVCQAGQASLCASEALGEHTRHH